MTFGEMVALFATRAGLRKAQGLAAEAADGVQQIAAKFRPMRVVMLSDSLGAANSDRSIGNNHGSRSMMTAAAIASNGWALLVGNAGIGGQTSTQITWRVWRDVVRYEADACVLEMGTNDDDALALGIKLAKVYNQLRSAGVKLVVCNLPPKTGAMALVRTKNSIIASFCALNNIPLVDLYSIGVNAGDTDWKSNYSYDGTHYLQTVASLFGAAIWSKLAGFIDASASVPILQDIARANILANYYNGLFLDTGAASAGTTGIQPLGFNAYKVSGTIASAVSDVSRTSPGGEGKWWDVTVTPSPGSQFIYTLDSSRYVSTAGLNNLRRYQGRRVLFVFCVSCSGLTAQNAAAFVGASTSDPEVAAVQMAVRYYDKDNSVVGGAVSSPLYYVDPDDAGNNISIRNCICFGASVFPAGNYHGFAQDMDKAILAGEMIVPEGAATLHFQAQIHGTSGVSATPINLSITELNLIDMGPAPGIIRPHPSLLTGTRLLTATATLGAADNVAVYEVDATSAAFVPTLPAANVMGGRTLTFVKTDSSANAVTVTAASGDAINGGTTAALTSQWQTVKVRSNGKAWRIV